MIPPKRLYKRAVGKQKSIDENYYTIAYDGCQHFKYARYLQNINAREGDFIEAGSCEVTVRCRMKR